MNTEGQANSESGGMGKAQKIHMVFNGAWHYQHFVQICSEGIGNKGTIGQSGASGVV